jgi:hypothetical protein
MTAGDRVRCAESRESKYSNNSDTNQGQVELTTPGFDEAESSHLEESKEKRIRKAWHGWGGHASDADLGLAWLFSTFTSETSRFKTAWD